MSPLARWQAEEVGRRLQQIDSGSRVELLPMQTQGDQWLGTALAKLGGKGLFVKELEAALLDKRADLAVHSMKDVTAVLPEGLTISTVLAREDPTDAFVSNDIEHFDKLPEAAIVGTCSVRRQSQLLAVRPDLQIRLLRGNVNTRLAKLDAGEFDAIILASAGLKRLGLTSRIRHPLPRELCLPAIGQGIIGIEIRADDNQLADRLRPLHHEATAARLSAERALSAALNGGCSAPIAGYCECDEDSLVLSARVLSLDGTVVLQKSARAPARGAQALGLEVARQLREAGAQQLLDAAARAFA